MNLAAKMKDTPNMEKAIVPAKDRGEAQKKATHMATIYNATDLADTTRNWTSSSRTLASMPRRAKLVLTRVR